MSELALADFDAFTFDVYGTLIDWEPPIVTFLERWAARLGIATTGAALLATYDGIRSEVQQERPVLLYPDVLRRSFDRVCAAHGVPADPDLREAFAHEPASWPAYPDSHDGLVALQARGKICALSNIDDASLAASARVLDVRFDLLVTAERVGAYKPDFAHFHTALAELGAMGIPPRRILHIAQSLRADIGPANRLGLTCVWVNRQGRALGLSGAAAKAAKPDVTVASLAEIVTLLGAP